MFSALIGVKTSLSVDCALAESELGWEPSVDLDTGISLAVEWWNESWFWDWYDADAEVAGHCRIGMHPNQDRLWVWFFLKHGDEWVGVEEPRLPLASFDADRLAYDGWGLRFSWEVISPIRQFSMPASDSIRCMLSAKKELTTSTRPSPMLKTRAISESSMPPNR